MDDATAVLVCNVLIGVSVLLLTGMTTAMVALHFPDSDWAQRKLLVFCNVLLPLTALAAAAMGIQDRMMAAVARG